jgi:hypothetical protein
MADLFGWDDPVDESGRQVFVSVLEEHTRVSAVEQIDRMRYVLKRPGKRMVNVWLCNVYIVSEADVHAIIGRWPDVDAIVTLSGHNSYTPDAVKVARQNDAGVFKLRELMSALHNADILA